MVVSFKEQCGREESTGEHRETMDGSKMLINISSWEIGFLVAVYGVKGFKNNSGKTDTCQCFEWEVIYIH